MVFRQAGGLSRKDSSIKRVDSEGNGAIEWTWQSSRTSEFRLSMRQATSERSLDVRVSSME